MLMAAADFDALSCLLARDQMLYVSFHEKHFAGRGLSSQMTEFVCSRRGAIKLSVHAGTRGCRGVPVKQQSGLLYCILDDIFSYYYDYYYYYAAFIRMTNCRRDVEFLVIFY